MVYGETFLRYFKFYAKTLTKLHDLTVPSAVWCSGVGEGGGGELTDIPSTLIVGDVYCYCLVYIVQTTRIFSQAPQLTPAINTKVTIISANFQKKIFSGTIGILSGQRENLVSDSL